MNTELKISLKRLNLPYWKVAKKIGIAEVTFCRWIRYELTDYQKEKINDAVTQLTNGKGVVNYG